MVTDETTSLRGREFKLVSPGLCKKDVIALLDSIEESHTASVARLEHVDALHELASRTVEEAQVVAEETRQRLTVEAEAAIAAAIGKAHEQARELVDEARDASLKMIEAAESEAELLRTQALEKAESDAKRLIADARKSADRIVADAIDIAQGILSDVDTHSVRPMPVTPARNAGAATQERHGEGPAIRWEPVSGATRYSLYITEPPHDENHVVFESGDIEDTALSIPVELEEGVSYQWTIRAGNESGWGPFAPQMDLTI